MLAPLLDVGGTRTLFLEYLDAQAQHKAATRQGRNALSDVRDRLSRILYNADKSVLATVIFGP